MGSYILCKILNFAFKPRYTKCIQYSKRNNRAVPLQYSELIFLQLNEKLNTNERNIVEKNKTDSPAIIWQRGHANLFC